MRNLLDRLAWWWIGRRFAKQLPAFCDQGHRAQGKMWGERCAVCDDDPYNIGTRLRIFEPGAQDQAATLLDGKTRFPDDAA